LHLLRHRHLWRPLPPFRLLPQPQLRPLWQRLPLRHLHQSLLRLPLLLRHLWRRLSLRLLLLRQKRQRLLRLPWLLLRRRLL
jgi:hypothetical protein